MLWGAGLGWLIGFSVAHLLETFHHTGPGVVHYGDGERSPEWSERVPEHQYKRHNYVEGGVLLATGLFLWFIVAKGARDAAAEQATNLSYLEASRDALFAYHDALRSVMTKHSDIFKRATAAAENDPAYRQAKAEADKAYRTYSRAQKTLRGDT